MQDGKCLRAEGGGEEETPRGVKAVGRGVGDNERGDAAGDRGGAAFLFVHITSISSKFVEQENLSSRVLSLRSPTHGLLLWSPLGSRSAHESPLVQPTL